MRRRLLHFFRQFTVSTLEQSQLDPFPIRHSLRNYRSSFLLKDGRAALNVALIALPQGMAYAAIAGLPIVNGLVCSTIATLVSPLFSSSNHTILGPTNATSFMLFSFFASHPELDTTALLPLIILLVGILCTLGAIFRIAELLQFVSRSVLVGYITGAAILIMGNQFKHLLHIETEGKTFFTLIQSIAHHLPHFEWQPLLIGLATLALYLLLNRKFTALPNFALALVLMSFFTWVLGKFTSLGFEDITTFQGFGLDAFHPRLPTLGGFDSFYQACNELTLIVFAIAFLASLENTVMSKSLASRTGDRSDVNQDMLAVGASNLACSCLAGMPASGSLVRSSLNYSSGAASRLSSIFCGFLCVVGVVIFARFPIVTYIPKTCLAALVIGIAISLINWKNIRICLKSTPGDAAVLIITFLSALIAPLYIAIFVGVALSITIFLRKASHPHLVEYEISEQGELRELGEKRPRPNPAISIVHIEGDLFFGAADLFRTQVMRIATDPNLKIIILRLKNARHLDATSVLALSDLINHSRKEGRHILVSGATREVYRVLKRSGVLDTIQQGCDRSKHESNLFPYAPSNPNISTRNALKRAQQLLGTNQADIKIYYDPSKS